MSQSGCRLQKVGALAFSDVLQNQYLKPEVATVSFQQTYLTHCCFETLCSVIKIVNSYHKLGIADSKKKIDPAIMTFIHLQALMLMLAIMAHSMNDVCKH